jgi:hypothetical protein
MKTRIKILIRKGGKPIQTDQKFAVLARMILKSPFVKGMEISLG